MNKVKYNNRTFVNVQNISKELNLILIFVLDYVFLQRRIIEATSLVESKSNILIIKSEITHGELT